MDPIKFIAGILKKNQSTSQPALDDAVKAEMEKTAARGQQIIDMINSR